MAWRQATPARTRSEPCGSNRVLLPALWVMLAASAGHAQVPVDGRAMLKNPANPVFQAPAPATFKVRFETTRGVFVVELTRKWAPLGVDRLYHLVTFGFFDDSRVFRMIPSFVAQFGIAGDTALSAVWSKRVMPDDPVRKSNARGTLVYASDGKNTRTTELFINLRDDSQLDQLGFSPIGRVVQGLEVLDNLYGGYGELTGAGPDRGDQDSLFASGNAFLDRVFPRLDKIVRATVVPPVPL